MKTNVYTIYDTAAATYLRFWPSPTDAQAMREFTDAVNEPETAIGKHPEDYYLVRIGSYNDQDAKLVPEPVETLLTGLEARASANKTANANLDMFAPDSPGGTD